MDVALVMNVIAVLEAEHPVIPPREALLRLLEQAEAVLQAHRFEPPEGGALRFGAEHLSGPGRRIMYVPVVRRDVEVTGERQVRV
jgi:hypothetical protein